MRKEHWHQLGPNDQAKSIFMGLTDWIELLKMYPDGTKEGREKWHKEIEQSIKELKTLCYEYLPNDWKGDEGLTDQEKCAKIFGTHGH
jgi:hypothetical protein